MSAVKPLTSQPLQNDGWDVRDIKMLRGVLAGGKGLTALTLLVPTPNTQTDTSNISYAYFNFDPNILHLTSLTDKHPRGVYVNQGGVRDVQKRCDAVDFLEVCF